MINYALRLAIGHYSMISNIFFLYRIITKLLRKINVFLILKRILKSMFYFKLIAISTTFKNIFKDLKTKSIYCILII